MRHPVLVRTSLVAALAATCTAAHANAGIGFFTPASIVLVLAVVPVIALEGPILWWRLRPTFRRAMVLSCYANGISTLAGAIIGFALDLAIGGATGMAGAGFGREAATAGLVLMFPITLWIEYLVIRRALREKPRGQVFRAVLLANLATYTLLVGWALAFMEPDPMTRRARMTEVLNAMKVTRADMAEKFQATGRFPVTKQESPVKFVRRLWTEESGRIVAEVAFPGTPELDGKRVVYEPEVREGRIVDWRCYVPEAPLKYFPAACRDRGPQAAK